MLQFSVDKFLLLIRSLSLHTRTIVVTLMPYNYYHAYSLNYILSDKTKLLLKDIPTPPPQLCCHSLHIAWADYRFMQVFVPQFRPFKSEKSFGNQLLNSLFWRKEICVSFKVDIFWEGHEEISKSPNFFWCYKVISNKTFV